VINLDKNNFVSFLDWEGLQEEYELIDNSLSSEDIDVRYISVFRDDEYNIKGLMKGFNNIDIHEKFHGRGIPGARMKPFVITGTGEYGIIHYNLNHCYLGNVSNTYKLENDYKQEFKANFSSFDMEKVYKNNDDEISCLTEWYINGPNQNFLFNRSTKRTHVEEFILSRDELINPIKINSESNSHNRDYLLVELEDFNIIIHKIQKEIGPSWSNNIGIEYRKEFGRIPNENEREGISEIVSFLFGKHLLNVGYTEFNEGSYPIRQVSRNPWGDNVVSKSKKSGLFPIRIDDYSTWGLAEEILSKIIPVYLKYRNDLNMKESLWSLWVSEDVPIGTNIPLVANALEILKKGWFKSNKSKTQGVYLPKKQFDNLLKEDFENINKKIIDIEFNDRILRRMKNSFQMGANESLDFFFEEIGLLVGEIERKAIKLRNAMIHDKHGSTDSELEEIYFYSKVYRSLYNRVFLKLLNYDGNYIDYTVHGFPEKHISQPTNE
jgi:hypothetical protein